MPLYIITTMQLLTQTVRRFVQSLQNLNLSTNHCYNLDKNKLTTYCCHLQVYIYSVIIARAWCCTYKFNGMCIIIAYKV